jgi:hypothetical protein
VRTVFDREKRIEDNETLKRAFHLAESGLYLGWRDIERQLIREQRPRVAELFDSLTRKRIDKLCLDLLHARRGGTTQRAAVRK